MIRCVLVITLVVVSCNAQCNETCTDGQYQTFGLYDQDCCIECFCFNHSSSCVGDSEGYNLTAIESDFGTFCAGEHCSMGWTFINIETFNTSDKDGFSYFILNIGNNPMIVAPEIYHRDFRLSYGRNIELVFVTNLGVSLSDSMYIRISNTNKSLYSPFPQPVKDENEYTFTIPINESYWRVGSVNGDQATLRDLVDVIFNVTDFRFTGKLTGLSIETNSLRTVTWQYIVETSEDEGINSSVLLDQITAEICDCPEGHVGQFCDECMSGYYRLEYSLVEPCVKCQCNNLSTSCATPTGVCMNCTNNTQGNHCEKCIHGYYGDPANNIPCVECDCNGLSPTCDMSGVCDDCAEGYRGDHCEECDNGYHNDSDSCIPCNCSINVDTTVDPFCDPDTGECLACINNTEGFNCETCIAGYYGDALIDSGCQACNCSPNGTISDEICDSKTGVCFCKENTSDDCSLCKAGFFGNPLEDFGNCSSCPCPVANNSHASSCLVDTDNQITCVCETGYKGRDCGECEEGHFGNPVIGICNNCSCNGNYDPKLGSSCDMETGFCINCTNHTYGAVCENCINGYYGDPEENIPCEPCSDCNTNGTIKEICDMVTGICLCRDNITGTGCNECFPGSFGAPGLLIDCKPCPCVNIDNPLCHLNDDDITATCDNCGPAYSGQFCELCANGYYRDEMTNECVQCNCNGNVDPQLGLTCNSTTGECLQCQNNTFGFNCEKCLPKYFGDVPNGISCTACNCSPDGVEDDICDPKNGVCLCLPNVIGSNCSHCESGYWGLSAGVGCEPCNCCVNGSVSMECDMTTGECQCLEGVGGRQCCDCAVGYYNLTETGCSECECSLLSVSPSCNSTGYCECREEANGKKCENCGFGYTGEVPNCTLCHNCFFQWNDILTPLDQNVMGTLARIQEVLKVYDGFDVEEVREVVDLVRNKYNVTKEAIKNASVPSEFISNISDILEKLYLMYDIINSTVYEMEGRLNHAEKLLMKVKDFIYDMDKINSSGIDIIYKKIASYNTTVKNLQAQAKVNYNTLITNQMNLMALQADIDSFKKEFGDADGGIWQALNKSSVANQIAQMAWSVETKISILNTTLGLAEKRAVDFQVGLIEETVSIDELVADLEMLEGTLEAFNLQLKSVSMLSEELENSTMRIKSEADGVSKDIEFLMNATNGTLLCIEKLIADIGLSHDAVTEAAKNMSSAQATANNIHQIPTPSQGDAASLATSINNTIIPEQEVKDVVQDANETVRVAREHLEKAVNASNDVSSLQQLVNSIESDHSTTETTLSDTEECLDIVANDVGIITSNLAEVNESLSNIDDNTNTFEATVNKTRREIESGRERLKQLQEDANRVEMESKKMDEAVNLERNKIETEASSLSALKQNATDGLNATLMKLGRANLTKETAQKSLKEVSQVATKKLTDLLSNYQLKLQEVNKAREKIKNLEADLQGLTESFKEASRKFRSCYKTP